MKSKRWDGKECALIKDNYELRIGDHVRHRGELYLILGGSAPHKSSSTGRVYVETSEGFKAEYFPTVIGARWVPVSKYLDCYKEMHCPVCKGTFVHARTDAGEKYRKDVWNCINCYNRDQAEQEKGRE